MSVDQRVTSNKNLMKAFLDEADADAIKTVDFPPAYGADIAVSCEKAKRP